MSEDRELQQAAIIRFMCILTDPDPPINELVRFGIVYRLVELISRYPDQKHGAIFVLVKMIQSSYYQVLLDCGVVPILVQLLKSDREEDRLLAVWALGNIAEKSPPSYDHVISCGAMLPLLAQFDEPHSTPEMLLCASWTLRVLCSRYPPPPHELISPAILELERLLYSNDSDVLLNASVTLACLSETNDDDIIEILIGLAVIPGMIQLLEHPLSVVQLQGLRTVYAIMMGENDDYTQVVIDHKPLGGLMNFLTKTQRDNAKKAICRIVYKFTFWDESQLQEVIESGIMQHVIPLLENSDEQIKRYAVWAISNITEQRNHDDVNLLVAQGCIEALCDLLTSPKPYLVSAALDALGDILIVGFTGAGQGYLYITRIYDAGGFEPLVALQEHPNEDIRDKASDIIVDYSDYWDD
ncbi:importin subunit alpha-6-like [Eutrema salsugineum]|uniref:importin subunit alpha-6-like n=1 Tax=Eutrema salsugineum TaxID=72664 RepID=UPI000CED4DC8|nr:importin subunit alpha-6-like [Eutrema salsugineum]